MELTFELHQHRYTVKRSPTYYREGYKTPKMAQAYFDDGQQIIEGIKEVNAKIKELLGVDVRQFKQIVMIAQGEFTKLIMPVVKKENVFYVMFFIVNHLSSLKIY